jgi:hypothetical protein
MAEFVEEIRAAFPDWEMVHNSLWFAGRDSNTVSFVQRQIKAADYINLERGVIDGGIGTGTGEWSLQAFFAFIDRVHELGRGVILDNDPGNIDYALAAFYLIANGQDSFGSRGLKPSDNWPGYHLDLGSPLGGRFHWNGLICRVFQKGVALLSPPGGPTKTITLRGTMQKIDGTTVSSIQLAPLQGIVLVGNWPESVGAHPIIPR